MKKHLLLAIAVGTLVSLATPRTASAATAIEDLYNDDGTADIGFKITITHPCINDFCPKAKTWDLTCPQNKTRIRPRIQGITMAGDMMAANAKSADELDVIDDDTFDTLEGAVVNFTACGENRNLVRRP